MKYDIAENIVAFSTERGEELPFYVIQPHQVHGDVIREVTDPFTTREELEGVDALVTDVPGVAISVRTADCIPVLLYDPVCKAIAAVHDGWRGTVQHLSRKVIGFMHERYGTNAADLKAVIGPGIGTGAKGKELLTVMLDSYDRSLCILAVLAVIDVNGVTLVECDGIANCNTIL